MSDGLLVIHILAVFVNIFAVITRSPILPPPLSAAWGGAPPQSIATPLGRLYRADVFGVRAIGYF